MIKNITTLNSSPDSGNRDEVSEDQDTTGSGKGGDNAGITRTWRLLSQVEKLVLISLKVYLNL